MPDEKPNPNLVTENHLAGYFKGGDPETWYPDLWKWIYDQLNVRSVLDVGCAEGHSTKYFKELGCEVLGVDGSVQAKRDSVIPEFHILHDFTTGPFVPPKTYDLVWSCEFVEHVAEEYADNFLQTFGYSRKYIMMTHALPDQVGFHHVNCQSSEYWLKKMQRIGFKIDWRLTLQARKMGGAVWYGFNKSGLVFVKSPYIKILPANLYLALYFYYKRDGFYQTMVRIRNKIGRMLYGG